MVGFMNVIDSSRRNYRARQTPIRRLDGAGK